MRRKSRGWRWAFFVLIVSVLFLNACGGNKPTNTVGPPATVTLTAAGQTTVSLTTGDVFQLTISIKDAQNRDVFSVPPTFTTTNPAVQVSNGGVLCAGTWDSLTTPIVCTPATVGPGGAPTNVTATAGGITSAAVNVFVHQKIDRIVIDAVPSPAPACVAQGGTGQFKATARNKAGDDITASVGQINWQLTAGQVATASTVTTGPAASGGGTDPITLTAKLPGKTQVIASANNLAGQVNSETATFIECPIARIDVTPAPPITLSGAAATQQMTATAIDTTGATVATTGGTTDNPAATLTWVTTPTAVATVSGTGLVTGQFAGTSGLVAACIPNTCNINLEPVSSDVVPITVSGTSSTTAYAVAVDGTTLVPINTSNNTLGTAINLPANQKKNSMVFSSNGARLFVGTDGGMLIIDANANTIASNITNAPGKVLAVSPDGNQALVADAGGGIVRLFNGTANTVTAFFVANASTAAYTLDGSKVYILGGDSSDNHNKLFVQLGSNAPSVFTLPGNSNDLTLLASGSAAFIANGNNSRVLVCNNSIANGPTGTPKLVRSTPDGKQILTANDTNIAAFDVTVTPAGGSAPSACPTVGESALAPHTIGSSAAPDQLLITPDSTKAFVTSRARAGAIVAYDVGANAAAGSPSTVTLTGGTAGTTTGGITPDSKFLYVGGTDNKIHVIDITAGTDTAQIDLTFTPDFVAMRPR